MTEQRRRQDNVPSVIVKTPDELRQWRDELLERVCMPYDELCARAEGYALGPKERDIYETVRSIDYLLTG